LLQHSVENKREKRDLASFFLRLLSGSVGTHGIRKSIVEMAASHRVQSPPPGDSMALRQESCAVGARALGWSCSAGRSMWAGQKGERWLTPGSSQKTGTHESSRGPARAGIPGGGGFPMTRRWERNSLIAYGRGGKDRRDEGRSFFERESQACTDSQQVIQHAWKRPTHSRSFNAARSGQFLRSATSSPLLHGKT